MFENKNKNYIFYIFHQNRNLIKIWIIEVDKNMMKTTHSRPKEGANGANVPWRTKYYEFRGRHKN
jgi:hypothetical protein